MFSTVQYSPQGSIWSSRFKASQSCKCRFPPPAGAEVEVPKTLDPKPQTLNPNPETRNPKSDAVNPTPQPPNPQTLNPAP